jgi:membrane-bound metal-dependent hydrolase YbcI (DUF457 family)
MYIGHYGASFAAKRVEPSIPLWVLFLAEQFLDVLWAPFILLGVEKVRITPHFTGSNALDLYYMPFTHSLVAALFWSCAGGIIYQFVARPSSRQASVVVASAVFSHWVLDLIVHVPDLPLYDNSAKVGLGLWNAPLLSFGLEAALLLGGIWLCLRARLVRPGTLVFGVLMLAIQAYNTFLGRPPKSDRAFAVTALIAYAVFAIVIWLLEDRRAIARAASL